MAGFFDRFPAYARKSREARPPLPQRELTRSGLATQDQPYTRHAPEEKPAARSVPTIPLRTAAAVPVILGGTYVAYKLGSQLEDRGVLPLLTKDRTPTRDAKETPNPSDPNAPDNSNRKKRPPGGSRTLSEVLGDATGIDPALVSLGLIAFLVVFGVQYARRHA